ncbi:MAG: hypothetical protein HQL31_09200 [Planctomycetes bacterium]|nr:hypothetical protein [Planctomycetota bacterium]
MFQEGAGDARLILHKDEWKGIALKNLITGELAHTDSDGILDLNLPEWRFCVLAQD